MHRQVSPRVTLIILLALFVVVAALYYTKLFRYPSGDVDFSKLDPRDPYGMMVFKSYDEYYRQHPKKRPRNWPPDKFRPENIVRLQEESRRQAEEHQKKLSEVTEQYLEQRGRGSR